MLKTESSAIKKLVTREVSEFHPVVSYTKTRVPTEFLQEFREKKR
jgi:hypothetical protein